MAPVPVQPMSQGWSNSAQVRRCFIEELFLNGLAEVILFGGPLSREHAEGESTIWLIPPDLLKKNEPAARIPFMPK